MTLKTKLPHRYNKSVIIDDIEVKFDKFGMTDVVERHAETLIAAGLDPVSEEDIKQYKKLLEKEKSQEEVPPVDYVDENLKLKKRIVELEQEVAFLKEKTSKSEQPDDEIDSMNLKDLKGLCTEAEFPAEEWNKLKIDDLKSYIKSKLNS